MTLVEQTLKDLGLTEKEIQIYLTLLATGSSPASTIGKRTGIERTNTVYLCKRMATKGFLSFVETNKVFIFQAIPPKKILQLLYKESEEVEKKRLKLNRIMGELQNMMNPEASLPKIQFFEGFDGIISIFEDIIKDNKDIYDCSVMNQDFTHPDIIEYWREEYMPKRQRMTNSSFTLYNKRKGLEEYRKFDTKVRRTTLLLPEEDFPFKSQMMMYGEKIAFFSLTRNNLVGTIVQNDDILQTQFSMFKMAWKYALTLEENKFYSDVKI